ncbi:hypothetical protein HIM_00435 [Hirsutella minnesotensis 3608]|nr:hypothetical protein HIM_00435 [Hirsutella minnesotensis 3608]
MATANCLRSLMRPSVSAAPRIQPAVLAMASFSTSAALAASKGPPGAKAKSGRRELPQKQKKSYKKKQVITTVKKPQPGERKAFRKRIQLSNDSALPVAGLVALGPDTMASDESRGQMFALPDRLQDQLRALEAFRTSQSWGLFRQPAVLVREETLDLVGRIHACKQTKEAYRCILTGPRLSGKSVALLQALSHALLNEWVVIHLPEGQDLTNGNTEYSPIPNTQPMQFAQPVYSLKLLQNIHKANKAVLEKLKVQKDWPQLAGVRKGASLAELVLNSRESEAAWPTLRALWTELTLPGRPPVMLSLDGLSHICRMSQYRDPSYQLVHSHELALIRMFADALSGKTPLPNGGAVVAATSANNAYRNPSQELVLAQLEAGQAGREVPRPDPYERGYDERVYESLKNSHVLRVAGLSKDESRALMEYWGASGLLQNLVDTRTVSEKWALAGHGIVGELERAVLTNLRM